MQRMLCRQLFQLWSLMSTPLTIGTRGSQLALWQANWVKSALRSRFPAVSIELTVIKTRGDKILDVPLAKVGGKGLFVKEIEQALLDGVIDIAVHSMKDMPAEIPSGLCIGAIPKRETPNDVLISRNGQKLSELAPNACIGTSSLRRAAQLKYVRPDISITPLRGNLDTRLRKIESENLDAIVLAAAGVKRLNMENRISEYLQFEDMLPAVGQGALCIEIRTDDSETKTLIASLDDPETRTAVTGERAFLNRLEGSCQVPIAAYGEIDRGRLKLSGLVSDLNGTRILKANKSGALDQSETIGKKLAERLIADGADKILEMLKTEIERTHEK